MLSMLSTNEFEGRPITSWIETLAKFHHSNAIRHRLALAKNATDQGEEPWGRLVTAGVMSADERAAVGLCPDSESRGWLLAQLSDRHRNQSLFASFRLATWTEFLLTICFAGFVLWYATFFIGTLARLITSLT
jgi:hypothetical protein